MDEHSSTRGHRHRWSPHSRRSTDSHRSRHSTDSHRSRQSGSPDSHRSRQSGSPDSHRSRHPTASHMHRSRHSTASHMHRSRHSTDPHRTRQSGSPDSHRSRHSTDSHRSRHSTDSHRSRHPTASHKHRSRHSTNPLTSRHSHKHTSNDGDQQQRAAYPPSNHGSRSLKRTQPESPSARPPKVPKLDTHTRVNETRETSDVSSVVGQESGGCSPKRPLSTYMSIPCEDYYCEKNGVLQATDVLKKVHKEFKETLLSPSDLPVEYRLVSPSRDQGGGPAEEDIATGVGSIRCAERELDSTSGECMVVPHSAVFSRKPLVHDHLYCNIPTKRDRSGATPQSSHCGFTVTSQSSLADSHTPLADYHHYDVELVPDVNFKSDNPTTILTENGGTYRFDGFSLVSATPLDHFPSCYFQRYGGDYTIRLRPHHLPQNFTVSDLLLFEEYLFLILLELYDWAQVLKVCGRVMMFLPRFTRPGKDHSVEVLPMGEVLKYLLRAHHLAVKPGDEGQRSEVNRELYGMLVTHPAKSPSSVRVDRVEWIKGADKELFPQLVHFNSRGDKTQGQHAGMNPELKTKGKVTRMEYYEQSMKKRPVKHQTKNIYSDVIIKFPSDGFYSTGIYTDIVQHALVLPIVAHHVLFHNSLFSLEKQLQYHFSNRELLQRALTHPSYIPMFATTETHISAVMSNCGLKRPDHVRSPDLGATRGVAALLKAVEQGSSSPDKEALRMRHNEQLEFLGDAVLEFLCSLHLFHLFPSLSDGDLHAHRRALIKNKHLASLAHTLHLKDYILLGGLQGPVDDSLRSHITANCLEAILGAVFLDSGLEATQRVFARCIFPEEHLYDVWLKYPADPIQQQHPEGDRQMIAKSEFLQKLVHLEQSVGVEFNHIRLLARAFTHSSMGYTNLAMGNYQRMEFLGDAVLQFLASFYLYNLLPTHHEGHLSNMRVLLVHNKQLARLSKELGFDKYILTSNGQDIALNGKILADVVESFLAALLLDKGLTFARRFLELCLFPKLREVVTSSQLLDANTRLHQAVVYTCRQEGLSLELPQYRVLNMDGPSNRPLFKVAVYYRGRRIGEGTRNTVREARMAASEDALQSGYLQTPKNHLASRLEQRNLDKQQSCSTRM